MFKFRDLPKALKFYYIITLIHIITLICIKITGWNSITNILFFALSIVALITAAYILHIYFKSDTKEMSLEERKLKNDYGQIWVILVDLVCLCIFIFTW